MGCKWGQINVNVQEQITFLSWRVTQHQGGSLLYCVAPPFIDFPKNYFFFN